jgi:hypothetical protein
MLWAFRVLVLGLRAPLDRRFKGRRDGAHPILGVATFTVVPCSSKFGYLLMHTRILRLYKCIHTHMDTHGYTYMHTCSHIVMHMLSRTHTCL